MLPDSTFRCRREVETEMKARGKKLLPAFVLMLALSMDCASTMEERALMKGGFEVVEGGVIFKYYDPDAAKVYLVGDFNNWTPSIDPMVDENGDGQWTLFYPLGPGRYEYKFVVDGRYWIPDPRNPNKVPDGLDGLNSVIVVPKR